MFAVVMAGGGGTRLWPKSREHCPKQMHALTGDRPLVQQMVERLQRIVGTDRVFIITNAHQAGLMEDLMPGLSDRILVDPYRRDTAGCIGLAAVYLSRLDSKAVMGVFPADHHIGDEIEFARVVKIANELAGAGHVVTIGIRPNAPETGYGYIEMAELFSTPDGHGVHKVRRFVEKPTYEVAKTYVAEGTYLWNSGMFAWSIPTVLGLFQKHLPEVYSKLMCIRDAIDTPLESEVLDREYRDMQRVSVDYGIMEKLQDILVIPADFGWNDIGSWSTVADLSPKDPQGNSVRGTHIGVDTRGCHIEGNDGRIIGTVGVEDLIIVDTEDALLVCKRDRAQDVKKLVDLLKERNLDHYL